MEVIRKSNSHFGCDVPEEDFPCFRSASSSQKYFNHSHEIREGNNIFSRCYATHASLAHFCLENTSHFHNSRSIFSASSRIQNLSCHKATKKSRRKVISSTQNLKLSSTILLRRQGRIERKKTTTRICVKKYSSRPPLLY